VVRYLDPTLQNLIKKQLTIHFQTSASLYSSRRTGRYPQRPAQSHRSPAKVVAYVASKQTGAKKWSRAAHLRIAALSLLRVALFACVWEHLLLADEYTSSTE